MTLRNFSRLLKKRQRTETETQKQWKQDSHKLAGEKNLRVTVPSHQFTCVMTTYQAQNKPKYIYYYYYIFFQ